MAELSGRGIALVAHDSCKPDLVDWALFNRDVLAQHRLYATGTTGVLVAERADLPVTRFRSGPHGGDQQIGSRIAEAEVDLLGFFWDPLTPQPHEPDVRARLRLAVLANIPVASTGPPPTTSSHRRCCRVLWRTAEVGWPAQAEDAL